MHQLKGLKDFITQVNQGSSVPFGSSSNTNAITPRSTKSPKLATSDQLHTLRGPSSTRIAPQTTTNQYSASNQSEGSVFTFNNPNTNPNQCGSNYERESERERERKRKRKKNLRRNTDKLASHQKDRISPYIICLSWKSTIEDDLNVYFSKIYREYHLENDIPTVPFYHNKNDTELQRLVPYVLNFYSQIILRK